MLILNLRIIPESILIVSLVLYLHPQVLTIIDKIIIKRINSVYKLKKIPDNQFGFKIKDSSLHKVNRIVKSYANPLKIKCNVQEVIFASLRHLIKRDFSTKLISFRTPYFYNPIEFKQTVFFSTL